MGWRKWQSNLPSRRGILGINGRNLELIYTHNDRRFFPNADDKLRCKRLLADAGIPVPVTYYAVEGPESLRTWPEALAGIERFVVKPNQGFGGGGIILVNRAPEGYISGGEAMEESDITFHLQMICNGAFSLDNVSDTAFFEETVINHPDLAPFLGDGVEGVADIRLIFQLSRPVMAMARIPTRESGGKANLHQGGIGVGIDLDTGLSLHGCHRNDVVVAHPETGEPLAGKPIPAFETMLSYGSRISDISGLGYIGVDFVCDARYGPLVLEINARPGLNIQIANQCGLRSRLA